MNQAPKSTFGKRPPLGFSFSKKSSIAFSDKAFEDWRKYIYDVTGIYYQDNKKYLLESRLLKRINYLGLPSFEKYLEYVKFNPKRELEKKLSKEKDPEDKKAIEYLIKLDKKFAKSIF